jgi:hypothetical protein
MSWDELEPGQDDLVKGDGNARRRLKKAAKNLKPGVSSEEALYTDHYAGDPGQQVPSSQRYGGPVNGGIRERWHRFKSGLSQAWAEAMQDAVRKQDERRSRRGK